MQAEGNSTNQNSTVQADKVIGLRKVSLLGLLTLCVYDYSARGKMAIVRAMLVLVLCQVSSRLVNSIDFLKINPDILATSWEKVQIDDHYHDSDFK